MTFDTFENARKGHRDRNLGNLATEFADVMWSCHFSSGVVCQILQNLAKRCLGRFGIGHLPWQNAPHWDRKTRGDFHWLSRSAKWTSEERPKCGRTMKNLHSAVDWTQHTHKHTNTSFIILWTQRPCTFRIHNLARVIVLSVHKKRRLCLRRLIKDLALQWTFWVSKSFKHLFHMAVCQNQ